MESSSSPKRKRKSNEDMSIVKKLRRQKEKLLLGHPSSRRRPFPPPSKPSTTLSNQKREFFVSIVEQSISLATTNNVHNNKSIDGSELLHAIERDISHLITPKTPKYICYDSIPKENRKLETKIIESNPLLLRVQEELKHQKSLLGQELQRLESIKETKKHYDELHGDLHKDKLHPLLQKYSRKCTKDKSRFSRSNELLPIKPFELIQEQRKLGSTIQKLTDLVVGKYGGVEDEVLAILDKTHLYDTMIQHFEQ